MTFSFDLDLTKPTLRSVDNIRPYLDILDGLKDLMFFNLSRRCLSRCRSVYSTYNINWMAD